MDFPTTRTIQSATTPGVSFTINRMVEARRTELRLQLVDIQDKVRERLRRVRRSNARIRSLLDAWKDEHAEEFGKLVAVVREQRSGDKPTPSLLSDEQLAEIRISTLDLEDSREELNVEYEKIRLIEESEIFPLWVKWGLVSVEGLLIDGQPVTADSISYGPSELYNEIVRAIESEIGLTQAELKNSASPSTSDGAEGGITTDSTAISASNTVSISPEIAVSIPNP